MIPPILVFFFRTVLAIQVPFPFTIHFKIGSSTSPTFVLVQSFSVKGLRKCPGWDGLLVSTANTLRSEGDSSKKHRGQKLKRQMTGLL